MNTFRKMTLSTPIGVWPLAAIVAMAWVLQGCNRGGCGGQRYPYYVATNLVVRGPEAFGFQGDSMNYAFFDYELTATASIEGVDRIAQAQDPLPYPVLVASSSIDECYEPAIYTYARTYNHLAGVTITSDRPWNDTLPAGANLAHLFLLTTAEGYWGTVANPLAYYQYSSTVNQYITTVCHEGLYVPYSFKLRPLVPPSDNSPTHRFTLTFRTDAGREFTSQPIRVRFLF